MTDTPKETSETTPPPEYPFYKTTIVIWSDYNPDGISLSELGRDADGGGAIATSIVRLLASPDTDPSFAGAEDFFEYYPESGPAPIEKLSYEEVEGALLEVIDERDAAQSWADKLAHAIGHGDEGEHSNLNNPWATALEIAESLSRSEIPNPQHYSGLVAALEAHVATLPISTLDESTRVVGWWDAIDFVKSLTPHSEQKCESCGFWPSDPLNGAGHGCGCAPAKSPRAGESQLTKAMQLLGEFLWAQQPDDVVGFGKFDNPVESVGFKVYQQTSRARGVARNSAQYVWELFGCGGLLEPSGLGHPPAFEEVKAALRHALPPETPLWREQLNAIFDKYPADFYGEAEDFREEISLFLRGDTPKPKRDQNV